MNFLIALIYGAVRDEVLAFTLLQKIMQPRPPVRLRVSKYDAVYQEWRNCYLDQMPKLFAMCTDFRKWMLQK